MELFIYFASMPQREDVDNLVLIINVYNEPIIPDSELSSSNSF